MDEEVLLSERCINILSSVLSLYVLVMGYFGLFWFVRGLREHPFLFWIEFSHLGRTEGNLSMVSCSVLLHRVQSIDGRSFSWFIVWYC